ncbi:acyltransferase [Streptococcus uberis]|uniref:acyltransferase family protein n=1 Tax=Streptococcus uberis TaxID=1349 RepID=UPI002FEA01C1
MRKNIIHKRDSFLDISKGIAIILVILGHSFPDSIPSSGLPSFLYYIIYLCHMPIFFFISGFLSYGYLDRKKQINKYTQKFLKLYFFSNLFFVPIMIYSANYSINNFWKIFIGYPVYGMTWFIYVQFLLIIFTYFITTERNLKIVLFIFILFSIFLRLNIIHINFSMFKYFVFYGLFFFLGMFFKIQKYDLKIISEKFNFIATLMVFLCTSYLFYKIDKSPIFLSLLGMILIFKVSIYLEKNKAALIEQIGFSSLWYYICHGFINIFPRQIFWDIMKINYWLSFVLIFCITFFSISLIIRLKYRFRSTK